MARKLYFYQQYGVEEYYIYDPERHDLTGWLRNTQGLLEPLEPMDNWVSPRLGVRFDISGSRLILFGPDGQPFLNAVDRERARQQVQQERDDAVQRAERLAARLRTLGDRPGQSLNDNQHS